MRRRRTRPGCARSISLVVVLPTLPVTPTSRPVKRARAKAPSRVSARQRVVDARRQRRDRACAMRLGSRAMHHGPGGAPGQRVGDERMAVAAPRRPARRTDRPAPGCGCRSTRRRRRTAVTIAPPVASIRSRGGTTSGVMRRPDQTGAPRPRRRTGRTVPPIVWPCSWPLPATASTSPGPTPPAPPRSPPRDRRFRADCRRRSARRDSGQRPTHASRRGSRTGGRVLAARIVVGDDHHVGQRAAAAPISGRLPRSRSPPAPNTTCSRPAVCGRSARQQPLQRIRRMGVIDIDRGAVRQPRRQFHPAAHAGQAAPTGRAHRARPAPRPGQRPAARCPPGSARAAAARSRAARRRPRPAGSWPSGRGVARSRRSAVPASPTVRRSRRRRPAMSRNAARVTGSMSAFAATGAPVGSRSSNRRSLAAR